MEVIKNCNFQSRASARGLTFCPLFNPTSSDFQVVTVLAVSSPIPNHIHNDPYLHWNKNQEQQHRQRMVQAGAEELIFRHCGDSGEVQALPHTQPRNIPCRSADRAVMFQERMVPRSHQVVFLLCCTFETVPAKDKKIEPESEKMNL